MIDDGRNKMLDINTLMIAFEDYVKKASAGEAGVPINFYITPFGRGDVAREYMKEKYPDRLQALLNRDLQRDNDNGEEEEDGEEEEESPAGDEGEAPADEADEDKIDPEEET